MWHSMGRVRVIRREKVKKKYALKVSEVSICKLVNVFITDFLQMYFIEVSYSLSRLFFTLSGRLFVLKRLFNSPSNVFFMRLSFNIFKFSVE